MLSVQPPDTSLLDGVRAIIVEESGKPISEGKDATLRQQFGRRGVELRTALCRIGVKTGVIGALCTPEALGRDPGLMTIEDLELLVTKLTEAENADQ